MTKFVIYQDTVSEYRWRLKAANGEIVAVSEGYTQRSSAKRSAQRVKEIAISAAIVDDTIAGALSRYLNR